MSSSSRSKSIDSSQMQDASDRTPLLSKATSSRSSSRQASHWYALPPIFAVGFAMGYKILLDRLSVIAYPDCTVPWQKSYLCSPNSVLYRDLLLQVAKNALDLIRLGTDIVLLCILRYYQRINNESDNNASTLVDDGLTPIQDCAVPEVQEIVATAQAAIQFLLYGSSKYN